MVSEKIAKTPKIGEKKSRDTTYKQISMKNCCDEDLV